MTAAMLIEVVSDVAPALRIPDWTLTLIIVETDRINISDFVSACWETPLLKRVTHPRFSQHPLGCGTFLTRPLCLFRELPQFLALSTSLLFFNQRIIPRNFVPTSSI